jgi:hypothetical protein
VNGLGQSLRLTPTLRMILALRPATISRIVALSSTSEKKHRFAQPGEHAALDDQYGGFHLGQVGRMTVP